MDTGCTHTRRTLAAMAAVAAALLVAVGCGPPEQRGSDVSDGVDGGWHLAEPDTDTGAPDTQPPERDIVDDDPGEPTGAACESADDCAGDICIARQNYPGGYCTRIECQQGTCSGDQAVCVPFGDGTNGCLQGCRMHEDCRDGYSCQRAGPDGTTACLPGDPPDPATFDETEQILGLDCDPTRLGAEGGGIAYRFEFGLGPTTSSFLMVPLVTSGTLRPLQLETPDRSVDLVEDYRYHNSRVSSVRDGKDLTGFGTFGEVAMDWPILVPYAPKLQSMVHPGGSYRLKVVADEETPCLYVAEDKPGTTLDLNLYFVGTPQLDAQSARLDSDLQQALDRVRHIYRKADVAIDTIRYYDVPREVGERYRRVTSRTDAQRVMAYGKPPSDSREGHMSVDVFLVEDLQVREDGEGGVLGMSAGLPGAAGLHGNARNGLIFQTTDLGFDNDHVGHIMAHEIGHFLGLRHTTEVVHDTDRADRYDRLLGTTDPIEDTVVCPDITSKLRDNPRSCGDFDNLMFPLAPPPRLDVDPRLTDGQSAVMGANPLVRE